MGMLQRLSHDLRAGWVNLRHGTAKAATRALEEGELLRYRLELRNVDQQLDDLHADIGEKVMELYDRGEPTERILSDSDIVRMIQHTRTLQDERTRLLLEMNDITIEE